MIIDDKGWVVASDASEKIVKRPTVRVGRLKVPHAAGIVWHWTGGYGASLAENLSKSIQTYDGGVKRGGKDRSASWHALIARDGTLYTHAPTTIATWHAGDNSPKGGTIAGVHYTNVNVATFGVELENAGLCKKVGNKFYIWPYYNKGADNKYHKELGVNPKLEIPPDQVSFVGKGACPPPFDQAGFYASFTPAQVATAEQLLSALVKAYGWQRADCEHGHVDFSYPSKIDPGPIWRHKHLTEMLERIFGNLPAIERRPILRKGASGQGVKELQTALTKACFQVDTDGVFGKKTEAAVKAFQKKNQLSADGVAGKNTWALLDSPNASV
jgi:N-acetyl-anhydromuramyl-L-alanine amidase AmpD